MESLSISYERSTSTINPTEEAKNGPKGDKVAPEDDPAVVVVAGEVVVVEVDEEALTVTATFMPPEQWPGEPQTK